VREREGFEYAWCRGLTYVQISDVFLNLFLRRGVIIECEVPVVMVMLVAMMMGMGIMMVIVVVRIKIMMMVMVMMVVMVMRARLTGSRTRPSSR
jgi:hypothetical protein